VKHWEETSHTCINIGGSRTKNLGPEEKMDVPAISLPLPFCSLQSLDGLDMPIHTGKGRTSSCSLLMQV
jgi:hypothetical protein